MEFLNNMIKTLRLDDPQVQKDAKVAFYILFAVIAAVYTVRVYSAGPQRRRSWLKLRSNSPDPEKSDNVGKYANEKLKPTARTPGSESFISSSHASKPTRETDH
jgi:hypothetical protein